MDAYIDNLAKTFNNAIRLGTQDAKSFLEGCSDSIEFS